MDIHLDQNFVGKVRTISLVLTMSTDCQNIQTIFYIGITLEKVKIRIVMVRVRDLGMH